MTRWVKAVVLGLACVAVAVGQSPPSHLPDVPKSPSGATEGPRVGDVIALQTSGQPDRRVKVVGVTRTGGEPLADLQDLATSARYTVPVRMLTPSPRSVQTAATGWAPPPTRPPVTAKAQAPAAPPIKSPERIVVARPPATDLPSVRPSTRLATRAKPNFMPKVPATATPKLPRDVSLPRVAVPEVKAMVSIPRPTPRAPRIQPDTAPPQLSPHVPKALPTPMALETDPYLRDLVGALRPSVREEAATALAEGRYGWRPEIQAHLARAAAEDPAPSVRAHCIRLLSKLGFHESDYRTQLESWAATAEPQLRKAARDALARLTVKK